MVVSLKIVKGGNQKRVEYESVYTPSWQDLASLLKQEFQIDPRQNVKIGFLDEDGDKVVLASDQDVADFWPPHAQNLQASIRLFVAPTLPIYIPLDIHSKQQAASFSSLDDAEDWQSLHSEDLETLEQHPQLATVFVQASPMVLTPRTGLVEEDDAASSVTPTELSFPDLQIDDDIPRTTSNNPDLEDLRTAYQDLVQTLLGSRATVLEPSTTVAASLGDLVSSATDAVSQTIAIADMTSRLVQQHARPFGQQLTREAASLGQVAAAELWIRIVRKFESLNFPQHA